MDHRPCAGRTLSASLAQSPYTNDNNNVASAYSVAYQNTHLPEIHSYTSNIPPHNQYNMPQHCPDLNRYQCVPASSPTVERYNAPVGRKHNVSGLPPASMFPQPNVQSHQQQHQDQQQAYANPPSAAPSFQQQQQQPHITPTRAPAPPQPNLDPPVDIFDQAPGRRSMWTGAEQMPGIASDADMEPMPRDPNIRHVVGSQGRQGIFPNAPGIGPSVNNGMNKTSKANQIPVKEADRKFPCPNCNKTYLHAKHLKRHLWRHTGDRPYMCMFCTSTFSRSDILKRHFQKCSVRRGNPTAASHLSNPAANLKKSQAAAAEAATDSPASTATPTTNGIANGPSTTGSMGPAPMTATFVPYSDGSPMQYNMAKAPSNKMHRQPQLDTGQPSPQYDGSYEQCLEHVEHSQHRVV